MDYFEVITDARTGEQTIRPYTAEEVSAMELAKVSAAEAARADMKLSFAQLLIGLVSEGWITIEDGRAWRDRVALPAQVQALIGTLPEDQQFAVETRAFAPSEVLRSDPLVTAMGTAAGKTEGEIDNFFRTYVNV